MLWTRLDHAAIGLKTIVIVLMGGVHVLGFSRSADAP